ncbi:hypothetical protein NP493_1353g00002 [Ridgeia piscesae]|uniref:NIDO domain-containing protein n=1 Tax=Ridgeia piscesae TaxID=27915 RepID=A0AAD9K6S1_RIDPI|nr:hypothetical protein NP493_1353g00002 [Ridgeia piscesae]
MRPSIQAIYAVLCMTSWVQSITEPSHFYPYGPEVGDAELPPSEYGGSPTIPLPTQFVLFGACMNAVWVNTKGVISFDGQIRYYLFMPLDAEYFHRPVIAPLACDVDTTRNHGRVYFRATTDNATLQRASSDVSSGTDFAATLVVITTWHDVTFKIRFYGTPRSGTPTNTFQSVLVTDGSKSFVIFNYGDINWIYPTYSRPKVSMAGVKGFDGTGYISIPESGSNAIAGLSTSTNVGTPGRRVYRVDGDTLPTCHENLGINMAESTHFYPYGSGVGDSIGEKQHEDATGKIPISTSFVLYGTSFNDLWVRTFALLDEEYNYDKDGTSFFDEKTNLPILVAFLSNIEPKANGGLVFFRVTTEQDILDRATRDLDDGTGFIATWVFIATWHQVTYHNGNTTTPTNTFQLVLVSNGTQSYVIFNYGNLGWSTDTEYRIDAVAGTLGEDGINKVIIPGSGTPEIINASKTTNDGITGRWHYRVDCSDATDCIVSYDCGERCPCTASNRALNKYFFVHHDPTKYVRCAGFGRCWVRPCPPGTVFNKKALVCSFTRG